MRLLLALLAFMPLCARAQTEAPAPPARPSWFTFGYGSGSGARDFRGEQVGFGSGGVQMVIPIGSGALTFQTGVSSSGESRGISLFGGGVPSQSVTDAHVGLGVARRVGPFVMSAGAGPSLAQTQTLLPRVSPEERVRTTGRFRPGAYGSVQVLLPVVSVVGIGVEGYGQTNADFSTAGARIVLAIGKW